MFSQLTIPITGDGEDVSTGTGSAWPCTQPTTGNKKTKGSFLQRLSQRTCSVKAVSVPTPIAEKTSFKEDSSKIRDWESMENIPKELDKLSVSRSPSLPSLHKKESLLSNPPPRPNLSNTPHNESKVRHGVRTTPNKFITTPANKLLTSQAQASVTKKQGLPQPDGYPSAPRATLQSITPRQQPTFSTASAPVDIQKPHDQEKENKPRSLEPSKPVKPPTPEWKRKLLLENLMISPSERPQTSAAEPRPRSPSRYTRNLFGFPPIEEERSGPHFSSSTMGQEGEERGKLTNPPVYEHNVVRPIDPKRVESLLQSSEPSHCSTPLPSRQLSLPPEVSSAQRGPQFKFKEPPPKVAGDNNQQVIVVNRVAYNIGQRLGRGGSSEVFQVTRQTDNLVFAIKCVDLRSVDKNIREGYLNEISLLHRMQGNPKVVQLIDFELCEAKQVLFVVMEKGARDLASFLKDRARRKDLRLGTVEAFWRDMVEAVAAIHSEGIIHSDLKPANFLLVGELGFHQLKLIDFGIASSIPSADVTSVVRESPAGTLNYMSPEAVRGMQGQYNSIKINRKSDIWSLGCILYNLLYGRTPFQHVTHVLMKTEAICNPQHVIDFPERSPSLPDEGVIPRPLLETVRACLNRDPVARPSALQLLAIKYCGCENQQPNALDTLAQGIVSVIVNHPLGRELSERVFAALQREEAKKNGRVAERFGH